MPTDLKQFHDAFFEESIEAIDEMESSLLNLDVRNIDIEQINTIFRGAHSIKGCSATFGFEEISSFVHVMETILDEMREGSLTPSQNSVEILLKAIDALRDMIAITKDETAYDKIYLDDVQKQLKSILNSKNTGTTESPKEELQSADDGTLKKWIINFKPGLGILKTGNDPLRMFNMLSELGDVNIKADTADLLDFDITDPEDCYLSWNISLIGNTTREAIDDIFEWVADECDIKITSTINAQNEESISEGVTHNSSNYNHAANSGTTPNNTNSGDTASIRVGIDKVDTIINMVGELVITQSMLEQLGEEFDGSYKDSEQFEKLKSGLIQLERNTRELQESVMRIRMLPINYVFNRVPRITHDLSMKLGKQVNIVMTGENTELDKTVLEKIGDPLIHLIRNALDHGIETPQTRIENGKDEYGTIYLNAYHQGGNIIVEIKDDGAGLNKEKIIAKAKQKNLISNEDQLSDEQIYDLIFHAGLSTAEVVSDVSGRGVGMDVVRKNIKSLGGKIEVKSAPGQGSTFTIRLPLTLAILDGQLVRVGSETYIVPLVSIIESLQINPEKTNFVAGKAEVYRLRNEYIPFMRLNELFNLDTVGSENTGNLMVIVESDGKRAGLIVNELLAQQQVVIKSLETNFRSIDGLSGATILGDGTVALIVDISSLIELSHESHSTSSLTPEQENNAVYAAS